MTKETDEDPYFKGAYHVPERQNFWIDYVVDRRNGFVEINLNHFGPLRKTKEFVEVESNLIDFAKKNFSQVKVYKR